MGITEVGAQREVTSGWEAMRRPNGNTRVGTHTLLSVSSSFHLLFPVSSPNILVLLSRSRCEKVEGMKEGMGL
jgi:hypothetical protein